MAATDFGRFHVESLYGLLYRLNPIAKYPLLASLIANSLTIQSSIAWAFAIQYIE